MYAIVLDLSREKYHFPEYLCSPPTLKERGGFRAVSRDGCPDKGRTATDVAFSEQYTLSWPNNRARWRFIFVLTLPYKALNVLNGHEYVAGQARRANVPFAKKAAASPFSANSRFCTKRRYDSRFSRFHGNALPAEISRRSFVLSGNKVFLSITTDACWKEHSWILSRQ